MRFEIGDVVRIGKNVSLGQNYFSPRKTEGIVKYINTRQNNPICVNWDGLNLSAKERDLKLVRKGENNGN